MRSGSTLLTHILNSNPGIVGYGETHRYYRSRQDLDDLIMHEAVLLRRVLNQEQYVLDKILHDAHIVQEQIIAGPDVLVLFLVREPVGSIASMLRYASEPGPELGMLPSTEDQALVYYASRLASLERYAGLVQRQQAFFLTYNELLSDTTRVFSALESWLGLSHALVEQYDVHSSTGRWGTGDGGDKIRTGQIIKSAPQPEPAGLSPGALKVAGKAYASCLDRLTRLCCTTGDLPMLEGKRQ